MGMSDFRDLFRHPEDTTGEPQTLDKAGQRGGEVQVDNLHAVQEDSAVEEGGIWRYPEADAWPDSMFSGVPEIGQGYEQIADSIADKTRRDQVYGRVYAPPVAWNDFRITGNSPAGTSGQKGWVVKPSTSILKGFFVSNAGTNWVVSIFDGQDATKDPIVRYLSAVGLGMFSIEVKLMESLFITASGTPGELVVLYL